MRPEPRALSRARHGDWPLVIPTDPGEAGLIYAGLSAPIESDCDCTDPDECPTCDGEEA